MSLTYSGRRTFSVSLDASHAGLGVAHLADRPVHEDSDLLGVGKHQTCHSHGNGFAQKFHGTARPVGQAPVAFLARPHHNHGHRPQDHRPEDLEAQLQPPVGGVQREKGAVGLVQPKYMGSGNITSAGWR